MSILVATLQALKLSGGSDEKKMMLPDTYSLEKGIRNLEKHISILQTFQQKVLVVLNRYEQDQAEEIGFIRKWCEEKGIAFAENDSFRKSSEGALEMAQAVINICDQPSPPLKFTYDLSDDIETKIRKIVIITIYGGKDVVLYKKAKEMIKKIKMLGLENLPICMAKTQYSFTHDPSVSGMDADFIIDIDDLVINRGAGFIVAVCGEMVRMPGLPKMPQANIIDVVRGEITGVS